MGMIYSLFGSNIGIVFFVIAVVLITSLGYLLVRRYTNQQTLKEDQELTSYSLNTIALFYCVLVGLVVVDVQTSQNQAQNIVINESNILMNIYRISHCLPELDNSHVNNAISNYVNYVINVEWPIMQKGGTFSSDSVRYAHHGLWDPLVAFEPNSYQQLALYQSLLNELGALSDIRFQREMNARPDVSPFLWFILIYGAILIVSCSFMFSAKSHKQHILQISFTVSLLAIVLLLIYNLDLPFSGPTAVQPTPLKEALEQIDALEKKHSKIPKM